MKIKNVKNTDVKSGVIKILRDSSGCFISGEVMSVVFGISRAALWKHIESLRGEGYEIESFPRKGYRLKSVPEVISSDEIRNGLKTLIIGQREIHCFKSIASTNEAACALASDGAEDGTIVTAEAQTRGRGRLGRAWASPPGGGLYFSLILRPEMKMDEIPAMTLVFACAVARSIEGICGIRPMIKWPNDILIGDKKVCGILAETRAQPDMTDFLVMGIGVNVNTELGELPEEATSLNAETGVKNDRNTFLRAILENIEGYYLVFKEKGFTVFRDEVRQMSNVLGRHIKIETQRKTVRGMAVDIDDIGALLVKDIEGEVHRIFSGDVTVSGAREIMEAQ